MEKVKDEPGNAVAANAPAEPEGRWFSRLLAWRGGTLDRATSKDPTLWMHRDVTT
jgi:hypothetical protein